MAVFESPFFPPVDLLPLEQSPEVWKALATLMVPTPGCVGPVRSPCGTGSPRRRFGECISPVAKGAFGVAAKPPSDMATAGVVLRATRQEPRSPTASEQRRVQDRLHSPPPAPKRPKPQLLEQAIASGNLEKVRRALEADPRSAKEQFMDNWPEPALNWAIRCGCDVEIIDLLIEFGADVNGIDLWDHTPLAALGFADPHGSGQAPPGASAPPVWPFLQPQPGSGAEAHVSEQSCQQPLSQVPLMPLDTSDMFCTQLASPEGRSTGAADVIATQPLSCSPSICSNSSASKDSPSLSKSTVVARPAARRRGVASRPTCGTTGSKLACAEARQLRVATRLLVAGANPAIVDKKCLSPAEIANAHGKPWLGRFIEYYRSVQVAFVLYQGWAQGRIGVGSIGATNQANQDRIVDSTGSHCISEFPEVLLQGILSFLVPAGVINRELF